jgi:hypothetical protein
MLSSILDRIQQEIATYHSYTEGPFDVAYSCLFHEHPISYFDNLLNILWASRGLKIKIVISMTDALHDQIKENQLRFPSSLIHINSVRPASLPVWGHVNLFDEHMKNLSCLLDTQFTYFMFMSSNQLFIRPVTKDNLDRLVPRTIGVKPKLSDEEYLEKYKCADASPSLAGWVWWHNAKLDDSLTKFIRENQIIPQQGTVDGFCVRREHVVEVYQMYKDSKLHENCTFGGYVMEEILVRSVIGSKYELSCGFYACNLHMQWQIQYVYAEYSIMNFTQIYEKFIKDGVFSDILTIKPISRDPNDELRIKIRLAHHMMSS